jgi:predicted dehydrogenase
MATQRVIVVGAGGISNAWFPPLAAEGVQVAAVVDLNIEAARKQIEKHKLTCPAETRLARALRKYECDFVLDLTIPEAHCKVTCAALAAGRHVLGEKPLAASMAQARKMVAAAEKAGRCYMVSQSRRWEPKHESIRDTLAAGTLGPATVVDCDFYIGAHFGGFRDAMPSPLILDMAIHHFDLARYFTGADAVSVYAHEFNPAGSWYAGDAAASCLFEMSNGSLFTYRGSWCSEGFHTSWNGDWRIAGSCGTLLYQKDADPVAQKVAGNEGFHRPLADAPVAVSALQHKTMHGALREMLEFLRTGKTPQTECHDNIKSLAMVFAAVESSRKKRRVPVKTI